jgi:hypothetical protein
VQSTPDSCTNLCGYICGILWNPAITQLTTAGFFDKILSNKKRSFSVTDGDVEQPRGSREQSESSTVWAVLLFARQDCLDFVFFQKTINLAAEAYPRVVQEEYYEKNSDYYGE